MIEINVINKTVNIQELVASEALLTPEQFNEFIQPLIPAGAAESQRVNASNFEQIIIVPTQVQGASHDGTHTIYKDMISIKTQMKNPNPAQ